MQIHVGTSGYAYKEWKGEFYPEKISSKDMLGFYSERLSVVEINNTFHRMPTERVLTSWARQVPDGFTFAIKAPQVITHVKRMKEVGEEVEFLFKSLSTLDTKLGPVLFQFPKSLRSNRDRLESFLDLIPSNAKCAFAFRSPSWHDAEILDILRARDHSLCIEDTDEEPADEIIGTASWGYLRLRRADYSEADLSQWADRVTAQAWDKAFVFFKHEGEAKGPKLAMRFRELCSLDTS